MARSTITELPDFDLDFTPGVDYNDNHDPTVPHWIENEDGSGQWSDGWEPDCGSIPNPNFPDIDFDEHEDWPVYNDC